MPEAKKKLRIGFIHPDLGIGGAERLVVDAAVALQRRGHEVVMFTSRHDPERCFTETKDGTLPVHVLGSSLPRTLHPRFPCTIIFSILRSLFLTVLLLMSLLLPGPPAAFNPLSPLARFDVFIVDQQSVPVPLLRAVGGTRVVFYCHFPDKLLSGGWDVEVDLKEKEGKGDVVKRGGGGGLRGLVKKVYRWPVDKLEEWTTGQSDVVISNSQFSSRVYAAAFPSLAKRPRRVVYPCIDIDAYQPSKKAKGKGRMDPGVALISSDRPTIISFNRFEEKKDVALAIKAFAMLRSKGLVSRGEFDELRLVVGGGYDDAQLDNIQTLSSLQTLCDALHLSYHTLSSSSSPPPPASTQVLFILNFSNAQRSHLLTSPNTRCLLYTPQNEHFGIVPIEAMACGVPVLACNSGGPVETVRDIRDHPDGSGTGILCAPTPRAWAPALAILLALPSSERATLSAAAQAWVRSKFSLKTLGEEMETACKDALALGDVHEQLGDRLIWGGLGLMGASALGLAVMVGVSAMLKSV
ncbi:hypothetical protein IAT38_006307 [Cryptococcus sp. DSM 104549]